MMKNGMKEKLIERKREKEKEKFVGGCNKNKVRGKIRNDTNERIEKKEKKEVVRK